MDDSNGTTRGKALDLAKTLVRTVVRAFYEVENIVVVDALIKHHALSAADISIAMHLSPSNSNKTVQKLIGKLREGGLVSIHSRQEMREGATKPVSRDYYFIDYRRAIDSTKYRLSMVSEKIKDKSSSAAKDEKKEFFCSRCKSQYTLFDVLDMKDPKNRGLGFLCKKCGHFLSELGEDMIEKDDATALFNKQFAAIINLCGQIDNVVIPETPGEQALADMRPMPRNELNQAAKTQVVPSAASRPAAVKGVATGPEKIEVAITSESENTAAQRAADAERRAKLAIQNQLPDWYTRSTVTGDVIKVGTGVNGVTPSTTLAPNGDSKDEKLDVDDNDQLDKFYEAVEQERLEKARQKQEEEEEEEDDDDDDDDDFEEVDITGATSTPVVLESVNNSAAATPTGSSKPKPSSLAVKAQSAPINTPKESDADDDEEDFEDVLTASNGVVPSISSQNSNGKKRPLEEANGDESPSKKAKSEDLASDHSGLARSAANGKPASADAVVEPPAVKSNEESDEDDDEFETVI